MAYLETAVLQLQAGVLSWREFPRLAAEALRAGRDGETLRGLSSLIGEPEDRIRRAAEAVPGVELRLLSEIGAPERSRQQALWALAQLHAAAIVEGRVDAIDGAGQILAIVREEPDLLEATRPLEAWCEQWEVVAARPELRSLIVEAATRMTRTLPPM